MRGAIIGKDISYTKSPLLYNKYFNDNSLKGSYEILDFPNLDKLEEFVKSSEFKKYNFFNITTPYKEFFVDKIINDDIVVNESKSLNLLINDSSGLKGYNTDAEGFYNAYFEKLVSCNISEILLVGTGPVARTVKLYIKQATAANLSVMSPRNNKIPDFFSDLVYFHPENTDAPAMCYKFDLMIFAANYKAEKIITEMPLHVERIINLNYQSNELKEFAMLNRLKYFGGEMMLIEQFKENLKLLNIYNKDYEFNELLTAMGKVRFKV